MNTSPNDPADMPSPDTPKDGPLYPHKMNDDDRNLIIDTAVWRDTVTQPDPIGALARQYGPNLTSLITWAHREGMASEQMVDLASDINLGDTDRATVAALVTWVIERADHYAANPSIVVFHDESADVLGTPPEAADGTITVSEVLLRVVRVARKDNGGDLDLDYGPKGRAIQRDLWRTMFPQVTDPIWYQEPQKLPAGKSNFFRDWLPPSPDEAAAMLRDVQDVARARQHHIGGESDDPDESRITMYIDESPVLLRPGTATDDAAEATTEVNDQTTEPATQVTWTTDQNKDAAELLAEAAKAVRVRQNLDPTTLDRAVDLAIVLRPKELADLGENQNLRIVRLLGPAVKVTVRSPVLCIQPQNQPNNKRPKPYYINPEDGTVRRQDYWRGDPAQLVGFQYDLDENQVDLDVETWQAGDIQDAIGTYPVFISSDGSMYTLKWPIESVREHPELSPEQAR